VTIREALGNSLNIPAFKAAQAVGVQDLVAFAKQAGLTDLDGSYGPAMAIGGVDLKPLDLAYAYTLLANGGVLRGQTPPVEHEPGERTVDPIALLSVQKNDGTVLHDGRGDRTEKRVAPEEHTFLVNSILTDPQAQCITFGCGGLSIPGYSVAVKTGTSEPFAEDSQNSRQIGETWAFGYTPDVVVGIWAGNADNAPITNITSTSIAYRAMRDLLLAYYAGRPATPFQVPPGVVHGMGCTVTPSIMCAVDYFLRDAAELARRPSAPAPDPAPPAQTAPEPAPANEGPSQPSQPSQPNNADTQPRQQDTRQTTDTQRDSGTGNNNGNGNRNGQGFNRRN
jgi:membrane peptidoglycan carboxypeptidase